MVRNVRIIEKLKIMLKDDVLDTVEIYDRLQNLVAYNDKKRNIRKKWRDAPSMGTLTNILSGRFTKVNEDYPAMWTYEEE